MKKIKELISASIKVKQDILGDEKLMHEICEINTLLKERFLADNKLLLCGNGGSAADAQHLAAEFSGRFKLNRSPLFAEALHVNSSAVTAIANDFGYEEVYSRMIESKGRKNDVLIGISTSGNSKNIVKAVAKAKEIGLTVIGLTGSKEGEMDQYCDHLIKVPSDDTPRIQEAHILVGHIICEIVELKLFAPK